MGKAIIFVLLILFYFSSAIGGLSQNKIDIIINEICTNNQNTLKDSYGNYSSWVELYNKGEKEVDLSGYGLSNEEYIPLKWTFPKNTTIKSNGYLIVFTSDKKSKEDELHTNFELNKNGDLLFLCNPDAKLIDKVKIP